MRPPSGLAIGWTLRRPLHELLGFMLDARKAKDQGIDLIEHTTAYYRGETGCVKDCAGCELEHLALNLARAINGSDSE